MLKFGDWINRKRHNRGFGIQSPSTFFFITQVLREKKPYYAYRRLDKAVGDNRRHSRRLARELFRIANHHQPANCISVGAVEAACAMSSARPSVPHYLLASGADMAPEAKAMLQERNCRIIENADSFATVIEEIGAIGMLYISADTKDILEKALQHTDSNSLIVIAGIHRDKAAQEWWQQVVDRRETVITFDMYSYGLLFFNRERIKQHYKLKR